MFELVEAPTTKPERFILPTPKPIPWFLKPSLRKEIEGKAHFVKFFEDKIQVDTCFVEPPTTVEGLIQFLKDVNPGYYQSLYEEASILFKCLSEEQKEDLRLMRECKLDDCYTLQRIGLNLVLKEKRGLRCRNFRLTNVIHMNDYLLVPDEEVIPSVINLSLKLELHGLELQNFASQGAIARANILKDARDGYFPLWILPPEVYTAFYDSVKGPVFRSFVLGDSYNTVSADLSNCYNYILENTPSPSPEFCTYKEDEEYHPEAAFCACYIQINLDKLEIPPLSVRLLQVLVSDEEVLLLPRSKTVLVHPWGPIKRVSVNLPTLWFLVEKLKLRPDKDFRILKGYWVIPYGEPIYPWKNWARKCRAAAREFPELKFLYQMGPTGGIYRRVTKDDAGNYNTEYKALATENPIILSHVFDLMRVLVLLGASECKGIKGIAADGWVYEKGSPCLIGPVKIGASTYGPFPVKTVPLELYYQFDPIRHDEIISIDEGIGEFWRPLVESQAKNRELTYEVQSVISFEESPEEAGKKVKRRFRYTPSHGDNIPLSEIKLIGDTLHTEIGSTPCHVKQIPKRLPFVREAKFGREKYG